MKLITVLLLSFTSLAFGQLKVVGTCTLKADQRMIKSDSLTINVDGKPFVLDVKGKSVDDSKVSLEQAAKELIKTIKSFGEVKGDFPIKITHVAISFGDGMIKIDTKDGKVNWPGCKEPPPEKVREFLDYIKLNWEK